MARRPAIMNEVPDWFSLDKYDCLLRLTNRQLLEEVLLRNLIYAVYELTNRGGNDFLLKIENGPLIAQEEHTWRTSDFNGYDIETDDDGYMVIHGSKTPGRSRPRFYELCQERPQLEGLDSVWPLSFFDLASIEHKARTAGILKPSASDPSGWQRLNSEYRRASVSAHLAKHMFEMDGSPMLGADVSVIASLDLLSSSDDAIIADLKELLPKWREQLGIENIAIKSREKTGASVIRKIIDYRVIPSLDLILFSAVSGFTYTHRELIEILFPHSTMTEADYPDKTGKYIDLLNGQYFIEAMRAWFSKPATSGERNGDRLVEDTIRVK